MFISNTSIPVTTSPVYQSHQYTSRCHHHATTVDISAHETMPLAAVYEESSPLAVVYKESSPLAAVIIDVDQIRPILPEIKSGLKDHIHTSLVENTRPLGPSSHIPGELVIPVGPAGNSLELCHYPRRESRTTAQSSLESSAHLDVLLRNLLIIRISLSLRLRMRDQYCTTRYPSVRNHL